MAKPRVPSIITRHYGNIHDSDWKDLLNFFQNPEGLSTFIDLCHEKGNIPKPKTLEEKQKELEAEQKELEKKKAALEKEQQAAQKELDKKKQELEKEVQAQAAQSQPANAVG